MLTAPAAAPAGPKFLTGFVDGRDLFLVYRDPQGQRMARRVPAEWSSFIRTEKLTPELLGELKKSEFVSGVRLEGEFVRICWAGEDWRRRAHERDGFFAELGITTFEADVDPVRRHFSETGALVGAGRRCYLDIETDSRVPPAVARQGKARVLCWSLADDQKRTIARGLLQEETDADERRVLEEFWAAIEPYDQVVAWFGDLFDFPVMKIRSQKVATRSKDPRRWNWMDYAELWERMNSVAAESGAEKSSRALNFVAQETIGETKHDFDARKTYEAWAAGGEERARLMAYCDQDTVLLPKLEAKTGYLALNDSVCEVCRVFPGTESVIPTTFVEGFMLQLGRERGIRFPNRPHHMEERRKFAGAWVLEPQVSGIRKNVHVVDFSGMYPSIIQTLNLSPETIDPMVCVNGPIPPDRCRAPATRVGFRTDVPGLLPFAVAEMKRLRKYWTKRQAELPPGTPEWWEAARRSAAYKRIVNIFYGIAGAPHSRFSDVRVAESVSTTGVWLIQQTIAAGAEQRWGLRAIYSDTDSAFFEAKEGEPPLTFEKLTEFVRWCNAELYPRIVREIGCKENHIDLAYEKSFERLVLVSKKRYSAVYSAYKGTATCTCDTPKGPGAVDVKSMTCRDCGKVWDVLPPSRGKPEIRGLEYRRGDVLKLARDFQKLVVDMLMKERCEDPRAFVPVVERWRDRLLNDPLTVDDVSFSQSLTKSLREYEKARKAKKDGTLAAEPAHVQVARILRSRGEQVVEGMKIPYVVVDGACSPMKVIPAADYAGECDRFSLWEDDVYPATRRLLEAAFPVSPGMSVEDLQALDWGRYAKVRPKRERKWKEPPANPGSPAMTSRPRKGAEGQGDLFGGVPAVAAPPRRDVGPYRVDVGEAGPEALVRVKEALRAHPGERGVEIRMLAKGAEVVLESSIKVAVSPELERAIERAMG